MKIVRGIGLKPITFSIALCALLVQAYPSLALADPVDSNFVDGLAEFQKLIATTNGWSDYTCLTELHNFKTSKTTISASHFYYKKGPVVRIEVVGGGFRDGSTVVRNREGKVTAKGGPWMGGIQMPLDPDSRMLVLPTGVNVMRADFPELFAMLKDQLGHGFTCKLSTNTTSEPDLPKKTLFMEFRDPANVVRVRLHIGADDHLPLRWESFRPDGTHTQTYFKNLKVNTGLNDELFNL